MNIKVGDYVETKDGRIGFVKTVKDVKTAEMERVEVCFDFEITQPPVKKGVRGFFSGDEADVWRKFNRIGVYTGPYKNLREKQNKNKIEPLQLAEIQKQKCFTMQTDGLRVASVDVGEHEVLVKKVPSNTELALKINEIINYLNTEGR